MTFQSIWKMQGFKITQFSNIGRLAFSNRKNGLAFIGFLLIGLAGCAHSPSVSNEATEGTSNYKSIIPDGAPQYTLSPSESSTAPVLIDQTEPVYPPDLLMLHMPPLDLIAQVIVDDKGRVTEVRLAKYLGDQTNRDKFRASVTNAVLRWRFTPLVITSTEQPINGVVTSTSKSVPFSLWYMFHFEVRKDGTAITKATPSTEHE